MNLTVEPCSNLGNILLKEPPAPLHVSIATICPPCSLCLVCCGKKNEENLIEAAIRIREMARSGQSHLAAIETSWGF